MSSKIKSPRIVRRCQKCNGGRWRNIGEFASFGVSTSGKATRQVDAKIVECMKCGHLWDIIADESE